MEYLNTLLKLSRLYCVSKKFVETDLRLLDGTWGDV